MGLARSRVAATVSCRLEPAISRETSSTTRSRAHVRGPRRRSAATVGSFVKCRSALFNPGGGYKKRLLWEVSSVQIQTVTLICRPGGGGYKKRLLWKVSSVQIQTVMLIWRPGGGGYKKRLLWEVSSVQIQTFTLICRPGGGQPPGLKSADRAHRGNHWTASRQGAGPQYNVGFDANSGVSDASFTPNNIIRA